MNLIWDYRNGFYVSERYAPLRYRARRFLEDRVIPVFQKVGLVLAAAAAAAFYAFLVLLEKAGGAAEEVLAVLLSQPHGLIARRIAWWTAGWAREPWEFLLASALLIPALAVYGAAVAASFLLVGFFLLAGKAAGKVKAALE